MKTYNTLFSFTSHYLFTKACKTLYFQLQHNGSAQRPSSSESEKKENHFLCGPLEEVLYYTPGDQQDRVEFCSPENVFTTRFWWLEDKLKTFNILIMNIIRSWFIIIITRIAFRLASIAAQLVDWSGSGAGQKANYNHNRQQTTLIQLLWWPVGK